MKKSRTMLCWGVLCGVALAQENEATFKERLDRFEIPGACLNEVEVGTVVARLEEAYRRSARLTRNPDANFEIRLSGEERRTLKGKVPEQSMRATLHQIAGQAGMEIQFKEEGIVEMNPLLEDRKIGEFLIPVPPTFLQDLQHRVTGFVTTSNHLSDELKMIQNAQLKESFTELGLFSSQETSVSYDAKISHIQVKGTHHEHKRLQLFLQSMKKGPRQIRATTKVIGVSEKEELETGVFEPMDVQRIVRKASVTEGFEVRTLPSVVFLSGQEAALEVTTRGVLFDDESWTGETLEFDLKHRGEGVVGTFDFEERGAENEDSGNSLAGKLELVDGQTLIQELKLDGGGKRFLSITAEIIDATGRRVR